MKRGIAGGGQERGLGDGLSVVFAGTVIDWK